MHRPINVFIGYDERQDLAYRVCKLSLERAAHPEDKLRIMPLGHRVLREVGLFNRQWRTIGDGTRIDDLDQRPFSTDFAFTRFLTPHYARFLGLNASEPCVFVDSDFVFNRAIHEILDEVDLNKPVSVVKHNYNPANIVKMDNQVQMTYNKKLWSSFMVFNPSLSNCAPSVEDVNTKDGSFLHQFKWLANDGLIGSLYEGWNFIPDHSEPRVPFHELRAIHYTEGVPLVKPRCKYSAMFTHILSDFLREAARNPEEELSNAR